MILVVLMWFGGIDVLVNNVGVGLLGWVGDVLDVDWWWIMVVDFDVVFWVSRVVFFYLV